MSRNLQSNSTDKRTGLINDDKAEKIAVLHVDDDVPVLSLTKAYLEKLSGGILTVDSLADPKQVFDKLAAKKYDVIICDYQMTGLDGLQILEQLRDRDNSTPFIMFTGRGREQVAMRALNLGADRYIKKGVDTKSLYGELLHAVRTVARHHRIEKELRDSERLLSRAEQLAKIGCYEFDLINDRSTWSDGLLNIYKFPEAPPDYMKNWLDYVTPEDRQRIDELDKNTLAGKATFNTDHGIICHDGEIRYIHSQHDLLRDDSGKPAKMIGVAMDITERKKAGELLKESEERLQAFMDSATGGFTLFSSDLAYIDINAAGLAFWPAGTRKEDLIGKKLVDLLPDFKDSKRHHEFLEVMRNGKPFFVENLDPTPVFGNKILDVRAFKVGNGLGIIVTDTTKRIQAEEALRESEERFRLAFENASIGMCLVDTEGRLTRVNRLMSDIFGYSQEELENMNVNDIAHPEDKEVSPKFIKRSLSGEVEQSEFEKRYFHKQGHVLKGLVTSSLVRDVQGIPQYFISHVQDITKRKQAEEELSRVNAKVTSLNDSLKTINSILRHDLSNDLTVLTGTLDVYQEDRNEIHLETIRKIADKSIDLMKRMRELEFLVLEDELLELVSVRGAMTTVIDSYSRRGIDFSLEGEGMVLADQAFISVIDNLVRNAVIHGKVETISITIDDTGDHHEIRIADKGMGIPDRIKQRIFEPGFTSGKTAGTGLGLYIVKQVIERYGGEVRVEDNKPRGSVFVIKLIKAKK